MGFKREKIMSNWDDPFGNGGTFGVIDEASIPEVNLGRDFNISIQPKVKHHSRKTKKRGPLKNRFVRVVAKTWRYDFSEGIS